MIKAKERTHATSMRSYYSYNRALPSSSKSYSFPYKESMAQANFLKYKGTTITDFGTERLQLYNLDDVYKHYLGDQFKRSHNGNHKDSASACSKVLKHCASSEGFNFKYNTETAIPGLADSSLVPLLASLDQRPDVSVSHDDEEKNIPMSLVEIHSSPYEDTIRKAIVTGLDLLRLRRTYVSETTTVTTFAFPNLKVKQCVVEVQLKWERLCFRCSLTPIITLAGIKERLINTFRSFPTSSILSTHSPCTEAFIMRLSDVELRSFGEGSIQVPACNSIIVRNKRWVRKKPFWRDDDYRLEIVCRAMLSVQSMNYAYAIKETETFFQYRTVRYDPMINTDAKRCLRQFYSGVHNALEKVHNELKLAHMDVRLDNICFNGEFQPILIDFDRAMSTSRAFEEVPYGESCMYPEWVELPEKFDWIQLGWVIAWVLRDEVYDYHSATFEELPQHLKESETLRILIKDGTCRVYVILWEGGSSWFKFHPPWNLVGK